MRSELLKTALSRTMLMQKTRTRRRPLRVTTLLAKLEKGGAVAAAGPTTAGTNAGGATSLKPDANNVTTPTAASAVTPSPTVVSTSFSRGLINKGNQVGQVSKTYKNAPKMQDLGIPPVAAPPMQTVVAALRKMAIAGPSFTPGAGAAPQASPPPMWETQPWEAKAMEQASAPQEEPGILSQALSGAGKVLGSPVAQGALTGATIGSVIPVIGTGIGAGVGAGIGGIASLLDSGQSGYPQFTPEEQERYGGLSVPNDKSSDPAAWEEAYQAKLLKEKNSALRAIRFFGRMKMASEPEQAIVSAIRAQDVEIHKTAATLDRTVIRAMLRRGIEKQGQLGKILGYGLGIPAALGYGAAKMITPSEQQMPGVPWLGRLAAGGLGAYGGYHAGQKLFGDNWWSGPLGAVLGGTLAPSVMGSVMGQQGSGMGGLSSPLVGGLGTALLYKYLSDSGKLPDFLKDLPGGPIIPGLVGAAGLPMLTNALGGGGGAPAYS